MNHRRVPSRFSSFLFAAKACGLRARRTIANAFENLPLHARGGSENFPLVLAESVTPLWPELLPEESRLQLGKVQNLRCAARRLHRAVVPSDSVFSFWKQLGKATGRKGYVPGRMLQEGCIVPSVGGGLCQLSNALYECCLNAGCEIVERHAHSQVIPGSAAAFGRDATVAWNYVDFRFRSSVPLLIEAFLRQSELVVRLRGATPIAQKAKAELAVHPNPAHADSCESCGAVSCFKHRAFVAGPRVDAKTAFLFDECWPEFQRFAQARRGARDVVGHPIDGMLWRLPRYNCSSTGFDKRATATIETFRRAYLTRWRANDVPGRFSAQLAGAKAIALNLSRLLTQDVTAVYVEQGLLPFLWENMDLGGRMLHVFMTRLPLAQLHRRLDEAFRRHPERRTLSEFRAPHWMIEAESEALSYASSIVTPHCEIASLFREKCEMLDWVVAAQTETRNTRAGNRTVAFPGPTVARKGAYELRNAAMALDLEVLLLGSNLEGPAFWNGVRTRRVDDARWVAEASAVVQPALVEDRPRMLLRALASGTPIVATAACGLPSKPGIQLVPAFDEGALLTALARLFEVTL